MKWYEIIFGDMDIPVRVKKIITAWALIFFGTGTVAIFAAFIEILIKVFAKVFGA